MLAGPSRTRLAMLHRWVALACAPVLLVILLSGAILALRPILQPARGGGPDTPPISPAALVALLDRVDPAGSVPFVVMQDDHRTVTLVHRDDGSLVSWDLATGTSVPTPPQEPPDFFDYVLRVHRDLWRGGGALVALASFGLILIVLAGPLVSRPRRRPKTALGWHTLAGWMLWPLLALLPFSLVLMKLHPPVFSAAVAPGLTPARAIELAARSLDLSRFQGVQVLRGSTAILITGNGAGPVRYVVQAGSVRPLESRLSRLGSVLHEGTWAGPWSGLLNLVAATALLGLLGSGLFSWIRRRGARPAGRQRGAGGEPAPAMAAEEG